MKLTVNGRDAVDLLRDALAEIYHSWDMSLTEEDCVVQLREVMTKRFFNGSRRQVRSLVPVSGGDEDSLERNRLFPAATGTRKESSSVDESGDGDDYLDAIAGLPAVLRSAMILSYLEGFSNAEIAGLASVQPRAIELLLERGRELIQEELLAYLMGNGGFGVAANGAAASG